MSVPSALHPCVPPKGSDSCRVLSSHCFLHSMVFSPLPPHFFSHTLHDSICAACEEEFVQRIELHTLLEMVSHGRSRAAIEYAGTNPRLLALLHSGSEASQAANAV